MSECHFMASGAASVPEKGSVHRHFLWEKVVNEFFADSRILLAHATPPQPPTPTSEAQLG